MVILPTMQVVWSGSFLNPISSVPRPMGSLITYSGWKVERFYELPLVETVHNLLGKDCGKGKAQLDGDADKT